MTRPGAEYVSPTDQLGLVPPASCAGCRARLAGDVPRTRRRRCPCTSTSPRRPPGPAPTLDAGDLDLDVVRELDGRVWVDDEDEFAEHQVSFGYPPEVIDAARASTDRLVGLIGSRPPAVRRHRRSRGSTCWPA